MANLKVAVVEPDRPVWDGDCTLIIAKTIEGDIGFMPGHEPYFAILADGRVRLERPDDVPLIVAVHGGFISVDNDQIKILAEIAELASEIDVERAERARDRALSADEDERDRDALRRAETRIDVSMRQRSVLSAGGL